MILCHKTQHDELKYNKPLLSQLNIFVEIVAKIIFKNNLMTKWLFYDKNINNSHLLDYLLHDVPHVSLNDTFYDKAHAQWCLLH